MSYNKFKDRDPYDTIQIIQKIYKEKLNLELDLSVHERVNGIYSATLSDRNAKWNTCGKGTTEAYCSASAYGESIEHLCNYFAYDITNLSAEANSAYGFEKYPDEIVKSIEELYNECSDVILDLQEAYQLSANIVPKAQDVINLWKDFLERESIPFVPYYSIKTKRYVNIPESIIYYLCGSNGGGAGNTPQEAIGHACDEILERYVKFVIYTKNLVPPEVPKEYVQKRCPELLKIIDKIEEHNGYKVVIKDASLGKGYSVMSVLLINIETSEYLVNFGAHPQFEIALERCLTELLQSFVPGGHNQRKNMEKWSNATEEKVNCAQNWVTLLKDDSGAVPNSYFGADSSWDFEEWPVYGNYSNEVGMQIQLKQLLTIAPDVYIRDVSYLGFPAYRVYVPTVSTSHIPFDEYQLKCYKTMERFSKIVEKETYSLDILQEMYDFLFNPKTFVTGLIFRSLGERQIYFLHAALCFDLAKYDECIKYLILSKSQYSKCLQRVAELLVKGMETSKMSTLITLFFDDEKSNFAMQWISQGAFKTTMQLYKKRAIFFSPRVNASLEKRNAIDELHIRLKKAMKEYDKIDILTGLFEGFII